MNTDQLLALYDRVADAPDAVPRLRRFVLDLAVRGKLVQQDPADEPASALLKRIETEKADAPHARTRKPYTIKAEAVDGDLLELPTGWEWVPLAGISDVTMGQSPPGETYNKSGDGMPLINGPVEFTPGPFGRTIVNQFTTAPKKTCEEGDLLICVRGSTTGRTNVAAFRACIGRGVAAIRSTFDDDYVRLFLWQAREDIISMGRGIAFPSISKKQLEALSIPFPPLAEQHRIAAKVDELMVLCDRLEEARVAREDSRDRLTNASYACLTVSDVDDVVFQAHTRFVVDALPALTARADQVKRLRQTILILAVKGKLLEQDSADEPALELLKRIAGEKSRLHVRHHVKPLSIGEIPFSLPVGWIWSRIGELCTKTGSGSTPRGGKNVYKQDGVPFLRSQNVYDDGLRLDDVAYISPEVHVRMAGTAVRSRDILLNITGGSMGRCCRVPDIFGEANVSQHVSIIRPAVSEMADFLQKLVLSSYFQAFIFDEQTGAGRGGLPKYKMDRIPVAVPPLAEQQRIAAKVDELMTLCDRLEASLVSVDMRRACMLESFLREALELRANDPEDSDSSKVPMSRGLFLLDGKKTCRVRDEGHSLSPT